MKGALKVMKGSKKEGRQELDPESSSNLRDLEEARESFTGFDPEDPPPSIVPSGAPLGWDGGVQTDHRRSNLNFESLHRV